MKVNDVDEFLLKLSKEFDVPKPNYEVWEVKLVKKPDPIGTKYLTVHRRYKTPFDFGATFSWMEDMGKLCWITFVINYRNRVISKNILVHEFMHYRHYVERGYKPSIDREEEEKRTKSETRKYLARASK